ncbi:MAG: hypothetical protein LBQ61_00475, partial [Spirochaetales bacterium]|nr:hypothetical protein [Spirochaetales bacterium]
MNEAVNEYEYFASRQGFNNAAGHFDAVKELLSDLGACRNLAGELNLRLNDKTLTQRQLSALVNALLVDKFQYKTYSHNLEENMEPAQDASEVFLPWKAVDLVFVYHHPDLGYMVLDPKNKKHWELVTLFKKNELLTIYVGEFAKTKPDNPLYDLAIDQAIAFFNGKKIKTPAALAKGSFKFIDTAPAPKAPPRRKAAGPVRRRKGEAPPVSPPAETPKAALQSVSAISAAPVAAPAPSEGDKSKRRMTPFYGIPVT